MSGPNSILIKKFKSSLRYSQINFLFKQNFVGKLIKKGNKFYALKHFYKFKHCIKKNFKKDPNMLLFLIIFYTATKFHFIKKRFGGSKKEIPLYLSKARQVKFIIKKIFSYSKSVEKRKSLSLRRLVNICLLTMKKKGALVVSKRKAFMKAKENKMLVRSLKG
jgi:ribosomal protein S7